MARPALTGRGKRKAVALREGAGCLATRREEGGGGGHRLPWLRWRCCGLLSGLTPALTVTFWKLEVALPSALPGGKSLGEQR